jgi:hypothetical protein
MTMNEFEELEEQDVSKEYTSSQATNQNTNQGGAGMKVRRKRNIEGMLERLKRLQKAVKESEKRYYVEQGRAVLVWYQKYKQGKVGVGELEQKLKEVAEAFGKSLDEPIE